MGRMIVFIYLTANGEIYIGGIDVGIEVTAILAFGDLLDRAELVDAGIVHEDVDLSVGGRRHGENALDVFGLGNVALYDGRFAAGGGDVGRHLVGPLAVARIVVPVVN
jgi:hypothetical protein